MFIKIEHQFCSNEAEKNRNGLTPPLFGHLDCLLHNTATLRQELIGAPCQERGRCITGDLCKPHTHTHTHTTLQHPQPKTLQLLSVLSHSTCLALNKATIGQGISVCYCCDVSVHSAQAATRLLGWDPCHPMAQGSSRQVSQRRAQALEVAFPTPLNPLRRRCCSHLNERTTYASCQGFHCCRAATDAERSDVAVAG